MIVQLYYTVHKGTRAKSTEPHTSVRLPDGVPSWLRLSSLPLSSWELMPQPAKRKSVANNADARQAALDKRARVQAVGGEYASEASDGEMDGCTRRVIGRVVVGGCRHQLQRWKH